MHINYVHFHVHAADQSVMARLETDILKKFYNQILAAVDPDKIAKHLWQGDVLTDDQLADAELTSISTTQRKSTILSIVRNAVKVDPKKIWILIDALEKLPGSRSVARDMKDAMGNC